MSTNSSEIDYDGSLLSEVIPVGFCSVTGDSQFRMDRSEERYLHWERANSRGLDIDLNRDYEPLQHPPQKNVLEMLCRWVVEQAEQAHDLKQALRGADVLAARGLLKKIAVALNDPHSEWKFVAIERNGVIIISELFRKGKYLPILHLKKGRIRQWGDSFHHYMTDKPDGTSSSGEFRAVLAASLTSKTLDPLRMIIGSYVNCVDRSDLSDPDHPGFMVHLQSYKEDDVENLVLCGHSYRNVYVRCRLSAVSHVVLGRHDDQGILKEVTKLPIEELRQSGEKDWNFDLDMTDLHRVLVDVRKSLPDFPDGQGLVFEKRGGCLVDKRLAHEYEMDFLPGEFKQRFNIVV